jgi:predicted nucleotidyltransferase
MYTTAREQKVLDLIVDALRASGDALAGRRVVLFGSRAHGRARKHSDFDIGVVGDTPLPLADFYAIEDKFDSLPTLHKIDWVDFGRASEAFRRRALPGARVIHG